MRWDGRCAGGAGSSTGAEVVGRYRARGRDAPGDQQHGPARCAIGSVAIAPISLVARISRFFVHRNWSAREFLTSALVVIGALGASGDPHTAAADEAAYATLLKSHVRPGSVSGIACIWSTTRR